MTDVNQLITDHLDIWTAATEKKSSAGRGNGGGVSLHGIKKLQELILELAVRGKLVPQDDADIPAVGLLGQLHVQQAEMFAKGIIKKPKPVAKIAATELPFQLPRGWTWCRVSQLGHDWGQKVPESQFTYIDVGSINKELGLVSEPTVLEASKAPSRARKLVRNGTVVYSTVRPYLLNIAVITETFEPEPIASTAFAIVHPFDGVSASYLYRYFRSPTFISYVEGCQTGIAYPAINDKQFFSGLVPLPPAEEQNRIVAKVDELMGLCDALERQAEDSLKAHQTLVETCLATLTNSQLPEDLTQNWTRLEANFDTLFTTEKSVELLKAAVLDLGLKGLLVPQILTSEPATEALKRIKSWQELAIKQKRIRAPRKQLPKIESNELPSIQPAGWAWARLGEVIYIKSGDGLTSKNMRDGAVPVFGGNGITGYHDSANISRRTIVIGRVGFYCGSIHIAPENAWITDNAFETHFDQTEIDLQFLALLLEGTDLKENENATAQPVISGSKIYPLVVGLPPLEEQQRIVEKIQTLFKLCDDLGTSIPNATEVSRNLADTLTSKIH